MLKPRGVIAVLAVLANIVLALPLGRVSESNVAGTRSAHPLLRPRQVIGDGSFDVLQRE